MAKATPARRVEAALAQLTARTTRSTLYGRLADEIEGVDPVSVPVLAALARTGPTSASRLAEAIGFDRTVTTRYASRLEAAGLLTRARDPGDARVILLQLTPDGRAAAAAMRRRLVTVIDDVLASWPKRDSERFAAALERFTTGVCSRAGRRSSERR